MKVSDITARRKQAERGKYAALVMDAGTARTFDRMRIGCESDAVARSAEGHHISASE